MKVSVVIPVYNEEKTIKDCLDSLINQTEKPNEIIVVDNNSTDHTVSNVKKYKSVIVIQEKKQGITPARNAGFERASGDIIARCDGDTILPPDWIKNIKNDFLKDPSILGISMPIRISDVSIVNRSTFLFYFYFLIPRLMIGVYPFIGSSYAIKKTFGIWLKMKSALTTKKFMKTSTLLYI